MPSFRYCKPGYVALNVTDLARSVRHYRDLVGLTLEHAAEGIAFLRCSQDHHNLVLYQSDLPGIRRMAFQLETADELVSLERHLEALAWGVTVVPAEECETLRQGRTIRTPVPGCGLTFEFYVSIELADVAYQPTVTKIQRLGHVVVALKERDSVLRLLLDELNFKVSDHFGDQVAFLRCFPNPYHHSFGLARSTTTDHLHHINFMVSDIDDIGRANNRMRQNQVPIVYGPGRHDISNSIFLYFLDPDGMTNEYSFGMEEFSEVDPRPARLLAMKPEILDCWGGFPDEKFGKTGQIAA